jgi:hypothetical protein
MRDVITLLVLLLALVVVQKAVRQGKTWLQPNVVSTFTLHYMCGVVGRRIHSDTSILIAT